MQFYLKLDLPSYGTYGAGTAPAPTVTNYWIDDAANNIVDDLTNPIRFTVYAPKIGLYWVDDASNQLIDEAGNEIFFLDIAPEAVIQDEAGNILVDDAGNQLNSVY